jgi:hypothetical protein
MFGFVGRSCTRGCLGCLIPVVLILALLLLLVHLITTPPSYPKVQPATPAALQRAVARGLYASQATQQPVALFELTDAEATTLLRESLSSSHGLSDLEVHILAGEVVLTGQTALLSQPLVVSGTLKFTSGGNSLVDLDFKGAWIGQLGLPGLVSQLLTRTLHPQFDLPRTAGEDGRFACTRAYVDNLVVGVLYGTEPDPKAAAACAGVS